MLYGPFEVETFARGGVPLSTGDPGRWVRVAFGPERTSAWVYLRSGSNDWYYVRRDEKRHYVALSDGPESEDKVELLYQEGDSSHILLRGRIGGDSLSMGLRRLDLSAFRLINHTWHWRW